MISKGWLGVSNFFRRRMDQCVPVEVRGLSSTPLRFIPNPDRNVPFLFLTFVSPAPFCSLHGQPRNVPSPPRQRQPNSGASKACPDRIPTDRRPDRRRRPGATAAATLMVRQSYLGLTDDQGRAKLGRIEAELIDWRGRCRPMGPQYLAVSRILEAIRDGRLVLTGRPPRDVGNHSTPVG